MIKLSRHTDLELFRKCNNGELNKIANHINITNSSTAQSGYRNQGIQQEKLREAVKKYREGTLTQTVQPNNCNC